MLQENQKWVVLQILGQNLVFLSVLGTWIMQHWFRLSSTGPLTFFVNAYCSQKNKESTTVKSNQVLFWL
jgi:hypothetical protein